MFFSFLFPRLFHVFIDLASICRHYLTIFFLSYLNHSVPCLLVKIRFAATCLGKQRSTSSRACQESELYLRILKSCVVFFILNCTEVLSFHLWKSFITLTEKETLVICFHTISIASSLRNRCEQLVNNCSMVRMFLSCYAGKMRSFLRFSVFFPSNR